MEMKAVMMAVKTASGSLRRRRNPGSICPRNEDRGGGGGVFRESSSPPRVSVFSHIYRHMSKTGGETVPEAHLGGHAARYMGRVGPPLLAFRHPLVSIFCPSCFFSIKSDVVFFPDFISCKNSQRRDFAKNNVRISSFIQI